MRLLKFCLLFAVCLAAPLTLRAAGVVTYVSGPNFCSTGTGYIDTPYCTIPGEIPLGSFPVPPAGGTYLDPNFGGLVRILTPPAYLHSYSQPTPVSAHNRYIGIRSMNSGRASILNFTTGHFDYDGLPFSDAWVWDAYNDDIHYRIEGARILKTVLSTGQETVLVDYSQTAEHFTSLSSGGSTDTSKDNWLGFQAPDQHMICTIDLNTVRTYCADYLAPESVSHIGFDWFDYVMVSKGVDSTNGKRYVLLMGGPAMGMWSVNLTTGKLDFETRGPDNYEWGSNKDTYCDPGENCLQAPHADVMEDSNGKQYLVAGKGVESPCSSQVVTMDLSKGRYMFWPDWAGGGLKTVLNMATCGEFWPDYDIGCAKNAPYCVITMYRNSSRNPADLTTPFATEPHRDQIILMRGNGQEFKPLGITRSVTFADDGYWAQPRSALSPDGQYVIFDSNFGVDGGERVGIVSTQVPVDPVKAVSVAPAAVSGSTQTLTLTYSDVAGAADLSQASLWIKGAAGSPSSNSCMIVYDRAANAIKLADDSGSGWLSIVPGAAGAIQNSQCSFNGAGVSVGQTSNTLTLSIPLTLKPAYSGPRQVWISAYGGVGSSGWQQLGAWTVPVPVVSNVSLSPAAGNGATQTFTAVFSDNAGAADIASASVWVAGNLPGNTLGSCYITWTRATGQFTLLADSGSPSAASQNSQCSLDVASARASDSGNNLTLSLPITFKPLFGGARAIWMLATGSASSSTLAQLGSWTVPGPVVTNTSISPVSGAGAAQTFTAVWTDTAGSTNIATASLWVTGSSTASSAGSCYITWTRATNQFALLADSGSPSASVQNSQCSIAAGAKATDSGNTLTLSLPLTFTPTFGGTRGLWLIANGTPSGSAWQQLGSWTAPSAVVTNTSVSPNTGSGPSATFTAVWTDTAGAADLTSLAFYITSTNATAPGGCNIVWTAATNQLRLLDDAGAASSSSQNSQCTLPTSARAVAAGNLVTLTLPVQFKPAYTGAKGLWMSAVGKLASSQWQKAGVWTVSTPAVRSVSASPASGQGATQTFALSYSDTVGTQDLASTWFWFTSDFNSAAGHTCFGYYDRPSNQMKLLNDAGNIWAGAIRGSSGTLQNSQCSIDLASAVITTNGNVLTLTMAVTFTTSFAGAKELWMYGSGFSASGDWVKLGAWTVPAPIGVQPPAPVDAVSVIPATGAGSSQTFTLTFSDNAGANDLTSAWFWITPSFNGSVTDSCFGYYDRVAGQFKLLSDAGNLWSTANTAAGTSIAMQNSQCSFDGGISAVLRGDVLTLVLPVHFSSGFAGLKEIWTSATGRSATSGWKKLATWTVQ